MKIATVTPIYKEHQTAEEEISLRHLKHHLESYNTFAIVPSGLQNVPSFLEIKEFPRKYFQSTHSYNKLMLSKQFYQSFANFDYILIYQLDCLVFSDQLYAWCEKGYDYIGAPFFRNYDDNGTPLFKNNETPKDGLCCVGNGGFSLRKVSTFLKVLSSSEYEIDPHFYWKRLSNNKTTIWRILNMPRKHYKTLKIL